MFSARLPCPEKLNELPGEGEYYKRESSEVPQEPGFLRYTLRKDDKLPPNMADKPEIWQEVSSVKHLNTTNVPGKEMKLC